MRRGVATEFPSPRLFSALYLRGGGGGGGVDANWSKKHYSVTPNNKSILSALSACSDRQSN